jgi:rubrerythrin
VNSTTRATTVKALKEMIWDVGEEMLELKEMLENQARLYTKENIAKRAKKGARLEDQVKATAKNSASDTKDGKGGALRL